MTRLYGLTLTFFILAGLLYGAIEWKNSKTLATDTVDSELSPDFIAETLQTNIYNEKGYLGYVINAQRMEHYADLEVTYFEFPKYTIYPKNNGAAWKITAKEGTLYNNNRVRLENRVRIVANNHDSLIQEIHGKYLELDLNTNILSSEQTILIQGKGFTMYGSGLIVDLNTNQMTLTEHVQTIYKKTND